MESFNRNKKNITIKRFLYLLPCFLSIGIILFIFLTNSGSSDLTSNLIPVGLTGLSVLFSLFLFFFTPSAPVLKKIQAIMLILSPMIAFAALEGFSHDPLDILPRNMLLNILFFVIIELILLFITKKIWIACDFLFLFALVVGIANSLAIQARSIPIYPWDIASLGVALSVAGDYSFSVSWSMGASAVVLLTGAMCASLTNEKIHFVSLWKRLVAALLSVLALGGYCFYLTTDRVWEDFPLDPYTFDQQQVYKDNGFVVSFLAFLKNLVIEEPEDYDAAQLEESLSTEINQSINAVEDFEDATKPNVIIIMDEAFSDLSVLISNNNYTNTDPLAFIHSLKENTISGYASVSVKGGNTPNSEFELLTGLTMAFLPEGSIPFQQYIDSEMNTLVSQFKALGYQTTSMHPYYSSGWNREQIYKLFGFDTSLFLEDFSGYPLRSANVRSYISDEGLVNRIIDASEATDSPSFIYAVSMQNHGGYTGDANKNNFNASVYANGLEDDEELSTYLSLMKYTDKAVEKLITYYQTSSKPTIILFFGDHQPNDSVVDGLTAYYQSDVSSSAEAVAKRYEVPFFIWANFPIEEKTDVHTSLNYLGTMLLSAMDFPLTAFQNYLVSLEKSISSISASGIYLQNGTFYASPEELPASLISTYRQLQYAALFDTSLDEAYLKRLFGYATEIKN